MKKYHFMIYFILILSHLVSGQCSECKSRIIRVYDFQVNLPAITTNDILLIHSYYLALKIAPAVANYLRNGDPSSSCLVVRGGESAGALTVEQAENGWQSLQQMASSQSHSPSGSISEEYYITGSVSESGQEDQLLYMFTIYARNGETVMSCDNYLYTTPFSPEDVAAKVGSTIQNQVGTFYDELHRFEVKTRNTGEPYAIFYPEMELTPEKPVIGVGEKTKIKIVLKDCDGQFLKNRKIDVKTYQGNVDPVSVTTDDNGEASVEFNSVAEQGLIPVMFSMEYQEPWAREDEKKTYSPQTSITVNRPQDAWFLFARRKLHESRYHDTRVQYGLPNSGDSHIDEDCRLFAWVKIEKHILGLTTKDTFFVSPTKEPIAVEWSGSNSEFGGDHGFWSNEAGYIRDEGYYNTSAKNVAYAKPEIYISLDDAEDVDATYSCNFTKLTGYRTGRYHSTRESYIVGGETTTEVDDHEADTTAAFNWDIHDVMFDTSYQKQSYDGTTRKTTSVTQKVTWKDQSDFGVVQERHFYSETNFNQLGVTDYEKWTQDIRSVIYLKYDMKPLDVRDPFATIPNKYSLAQNYPNPFNPTTNIRYEIPKETRVTIKIFDVLGNEVQTLTDEIKPAGKYDLFFHAVQLSSGIYYYQLKTNDFISVKKMLLIK